MCKIISNLIICYCNFGTGKQYEIHQYARLQPSTGIQGLMMLIYTQNQIKLPDLEWFLDGQLLEGWGFGLLGTRTP